MSLSEKAAQLQALAESQDAQGILNALNEAAKGCDSVGQQAAGIIGDLPAGSAANGAWQQARQQIDETATAVLAAQEKLKEIANAVRQAGQM